MIITEYYVSTVGVRHAYVSLQVELLCNLFIGWMEVRIEQEEWIERGIDNKGLDGKSDGGVGRRGEYENMVG